MSDRSKTALLVLAIIGLITLPALVKAEENKMSELVFVDLDGDGFNDMAADADDNGIPDAIESKKAPQQQLVDSRLGEVFNDKLSSELAADMMLSFSDGFGRRSFRTRDLASHRGGFNSAETFGPGSGIGLGALLTGCVGPGCVVH